MTDSYGDFAFRERNLPEDDPRVGLMHSWDDVNRSYRGNFREISRIVGDVSWLNFTEKRNDPDFSYAVELEARLNKACPEIVTAMDGLRAALDRVKGWHIAWLQYERGEVIGYDYREMDPEDPSGRPVSARPVRGPDIYHANEGWILSSTVGPDARIGGFSVWVEVAPEHDSQLGITLHLGQMLGIELEPPVEPASP